MSKPSPKKPRQESKKGSLNAKQQLFVSEYLRDMNATQAAIRCGYSEKAAGQQGHHLLKNPKIAAQIEEGVARLKRLAEAKAARENEKYDTSEARWLAEVSALAMSNMDDFVTIDEAGIHITKTAHRHVSGRAIAKVSESRGKTTQRSIQLHSKLQALELLAKHKGYIKDRHVHEGDGANPVQIKVELPGNGREAPEPPPPPQPETKKEPA